MTRKALQHAFPQWEAPEDEPHAAPEDLRLVWVGKARIVRNRRRMRLLKRRGVPMMDCRAKTASGWQGRHEWLWFIDDVPAGTRENVTGITRH